MRNIVFKLFDFKVLIAFLLVSLTLSCGKSTDTSPDDKRDSTSKNSFKVMSYNIHAGIGIDGVLDLQRIKNVIKRSDADIIGLNEIDKNYDSRSDYINEVEWLADSLDMYYQFQKTTWKDPISASGNNPREFGHVILSKYPVKFINSHIFAAHDNHYHGLLEVKIIINKQPLLVYLTHLSVEPHALASQVTELKKWMSSTKGAKILLGDMNATPDNPSIKYLMHDMVDAFEGQEDAYTFKSNNPVKRIDYILGNGIEFNSSEVIQTLASDHFPIVSEVTILK